MRIYFLMRHADYVRNFEWVIRTLADRGHGVHLAFERGRRNPELAERLTHDYPGVVTFGFAPVRWDVWQPLEWSLGQSIDYLRYRSPVYRDAVFLIERAKRGVPRGVVRAAESRLGVHVLEQVLRRWERAMPILPDLAGAIESNDCDLLMVTPLVSEPSQHDFVRSARAAAVPTVLAVHSWDNLTNKGLVREAPDRTYVWNEIQRREAVEMHCLPPESVAVVGAHSFDHWFEWRVSRDREAFCSEVGLDPSQPFLLYLGSSLQVAPDERPFILRWIAAVRSDDRMREVGVLVRPHPYSGRKWDENPFETIPNVVVWPRRGAEPRNESRRADYYDSIHHAAAVVGLNTSALIEAAIVGRRTYTVVLPDTARTQEGTLHFHYLVSENGGPLTVARSFDEHVAHLRTALTAAEEHGWRRPFLQSFLRPHGLHTAGAPRFVEDLERFHVEFSRAPARRRPAVLTPLSWPLALILYLRAYGLPERSKPVRSGDERPSRKPLLLRLERSLRKRVRRSRKLERRLRGSLSTRRVRKAVRRRLRSNAPV